MKIESGQLEIVDHRSEANQAIATTYRNFVELSFIRDVLPRQAIVLDAGCGDGRVTRFLTRKGYRVVGIDISAKVLALAKTKVDIQNREVDFVQADVTQLPFRGRTFSAVLFIGTFVYMRNISPAIEEAHRVSAESGITVFNVLNGNVLPLRKNLIEFRARIKIKKELSVSLRTNQEFGIYHDPRLVASKFLAEGYRNLKIRGLFTIMPGDAGVIDTIATKLHFRFALQRIRFPWLLALINDKLSKLKIYYLVCPDIIYSGTRTKVKQSDKMATS